MGLTLETVVFYFLAVFIIAMSILTVTTQRIVRSATYLLFVLFGTRCHYVFDNLLFRLKLLKV